VEYGKATDKYILHDITPIGKRKKANRVRSLFKHFLPNLPSSAKILEIGPGRGEFARECIERKFEYLGIEPSEILREKLTNAGIPTIDQSVPPIHLSSNQFDLVHSHDFIEHLRDYTDVMNFFQESFRVLKSGGYISVVAPNYRTIKHLFYQYEYQHSFVTTRDRLINMLTDCSFAINHSRCFLLWLSPVLNRIDRLLAHIMIPLATNSVVESLISAIPSDELLFRVHKNVYDHVGILARKPLV